MYDLLRKYFLSPLLDFTRDQKVMKYVDELEESQWWPRDKILELQNERLRQLVRHAYDNVPYYHRIFDERVLKPDDIQSSVDLVKLPVLTKKLIRENFDQLMARGLSQEKTVLNHTGGSTGEPLEFYSTRSEHSWAYAKVRRAFKWWGYEIGDKRAQIQLSLPHRSKRVKIRRFFEGTKTFVASESADDLPFFLNKLEKFQPKFISGYPSIIYLLARYVEEQGKPRLRPKSIVTHSEQLYDFQRKLIRKVFACPTYSHYESFEMNEIAAECPEHSGHHVAAESVIIEISNNEGEPVSVGEEGRILNTNLHNYAMPFIRYDTGDVGVMSDKLCPCGRGLPLLAKLTGRTTDYLLTRKGKKIPGISLTFEVFAYEGVEQFQIIQENYEEVIVKVALTRGYQREHMDKLTTKIIDTYKGILGEDMDITVEFVDQIPATRTGKRRVVVSKLPDMNEIYPDRSL